jgi:Flp pilus assembly protein CpaB
VNKTKIIFIVFAGVALVVIGVIASFSLIQRLQADQAPISSVEEVTVRTNVVVTTRDLKLGDRVDQGDVEVASVPVEIAPRTAIADTQDVIGKIIKTDLIQGEMILAHNLADPTNNINDLSFILSDDHVLMAFPATDLMTRENLLQRGDIVDIFATFKQEFRMFGAVTATGEASPETETRTFTVDAMQRVGVTALVLEVLEQGESKTGIIQDQTGQTTSLPPTRTRALLLALNPRDALILKHLKDIDAIFDIVLRAPTSTQQFGLAPISQEFIVEFYGLGVLP